MYDIRLVFQSDQEEGGFWVERDVRDACGWVGFGRVWSGLRE